MLSKKDSYGKKGAFNFIGHIRIDGIIPLGIILRQMNRYVKYFESIKYINTLVHDEEIIKKTMKYGIKLKVYLKKNLMVNQCIVLNTLKLK